MAAALLQQAHTSLKQQLLRRCPAASSALVPRRPPLLAASARSLSSRSSSAVVAMAAAGAAPSYFLLNYAYVPDILERRGPYRDAHLAGARAQLEQGKLVMAGAAGDPVTGAVFVFKNSTKAEIEAFVAADPYVQNGLVTSHRIEPYAVVVGSP